MQQEDIERFAFYYLCGKADKDILIGKQTMKFSDFDRLTFITDFLGFHSYNAVFWNKHCEKFLETFKQIERLQEEYPNAVDYDEEDKSTLQDKWILDFCRSAPRRGTQKWLWEYAKTVYIDKGWEIPSHVDI